MKTLEQTCNKKNSFRINNEHIRTTSFNDSGAKAKEHFLTFSEATILSDVEERPGGP